MTGCWQLWSHCQERALSARVLHLTAAELLLERDARIAFCQCSHHRWRATVGFGGRLATLSTALPEDRAKYVWSTVVRQYTQRMFGVQRLAAFIHLLHTAGSQFRG